MQLKKVVPLSLLVVFSAVVGTVIYTSSKKDSPPPVEAPTEVVSRPTPTAVPVPEPEEPEEIIVTLRDREVGELVYLPQNLNLPDVNLPPGLKTPDFAPSSRRLMGVRPITNKERDGEFMNPRWSPDGLQVIVSRPAHQGIYVIDTNTGMIRQISEQQGFSAKWDEDGTITVVDEHGIMTRYGTDGTVLESAPHRPQDDRVFVENDTLYARGEDGSRYPLTTETDRFYAPVLSPDGEYVLIEGLSTGIYKVRVDGSEPPTFVGSGNNPKWLPDGTGFIYDRTADDGHHLIAGDIMYADRGLTEQANLTDGSDRINQSPGVGPNGGVTFESDGEIYVGQLR